MPIFKKDIFGVKTYVVLFDNNNKNETTKIKHIYMVFLIRDNGNIILSEAGSCYENSNMKKLILSLDYADQNIIHMIKEYLKKYNILI